jgi:hypothetical protein
MAGVVDVVQRAEAEAVVVVMMATTATAATTVATARGSSTTTAARLGSSRTTTARSSRFAGRGGSSAATGRFGRGGTGRFATFVATARRFGGGATAVAAAVIQAKHAFQKSRVETLAAKAYADYQRSKKHVPFHRATSPLTMELRISALPMDRVSASESNRVRSTEHDETFRLAGEPGKVRVRSLAVRKRFVAWGR